MLVTKVFVSPRPALLVVDEVGEAVRHRVPLAEARMETFMGRGLGLPAGSRRFARGRVRAVPGPHRLRGVLAVIGGRGRSGRWSRVVVLVLPLGKRAAGEQEK